MSKPLATVLALVVCLLAAAPAFAGGPHGNAVPEPASLALISVGSVGLGALRRKRRK